jgi:hypothetical protein
MDTRTTPAFINKEQYGKDKKTKKPTKKVKQTPPKKMKK